MPDGEAVCGGRRAEHRTHRGVESRTDRHRGRDADDETRQNEELDREPHQNGGSWGVRGRFVGAGPKNTSRMKRSE